MDNRDFSKFQVPRQIGKLADRQNVDYVLTIRNRACSFYETNKKIYIRTTEHIPYLLTANLQTCQLEFRKMSYVTNALFSFNGTTQLLIGILKLVDCFVVTC